MTNNIRKALKVFADLGVGSGPDHETETYRIERGAIRNARAALETVDAADDDEPLSARDLAMIDQAWENHKAALPVATVINDNQPGRTAIIEITIDPPTLPVGTKLYAGPKMFELLSSLTPAQQAVDVEAVKHAQPAIDNLINHQEQCDQDGVMVKVSRQALDEVLALINGVRDAG